MNTPGAAPLVAIDDLRVHFPLSPPSLLDRNPAPHGEAPPEPALSTAAMASRLELGEHGIVVGGSSRGRRPTQDGRPERIVDGPVAQVGLEHRLEL